MNSQLNYEISLQPDFSLLTVHLEQGQQIFAEPSAMASMDPGIHLKAGLQAGIGKKAQMLGWGGESLIINTFTAKDGPGEITFAPAPAGDMLHHHLEGQTLYLQHGSYVAHSEGVEIGGKWQGAKGFFSGEGMVLLKATGNGDVFFNSYGAILSVDVTDDYFVNTGYVVAFEDTLQYNVTTLPGLRMADKMKSLMYGREGLVCRFQGQGKVWVQTRCVIPFLNWINNFRLEPEEKKSDNNSAARTTNGRQDEKSDVQW